MYIFGSGFDSLAGQKNLYDEQAIRLGLADQQARQAAINQTQQNYVFAQRQAEEDARQQQSQDLAQTDRFQSQQDRNQQQSRQDYQFNLGRSDQAKVDAESKRRFDVESGFKTAANEQQKAQVDAADTRNQLQDLVKMAQSGTIPADSDMSQLFPKLTPTQVDWAKKFAQSQSADQAKQLQDIATEATRLAQAKKPVTEKATPAGTWLLGTGLFAKAAQPAKPMTEDEAFNAIMADKSLKEYSPLLQWDNNAQQFVPIGQHTGPSQYQFTPPPTLSPAVTNAARAPVMTMPPPVPPTAGTPPYQFGNSMLGQVARGVAQLTPLAPVVNALTPPPPPQTLGQTALPAASEQEALARPPGTVSKLPDGRVVRAVGPVPLPASDARQAVPPLPPGPVARPVAANPFRPPVDEFAGHSENGMIPLSGPKGSWLEYNAGTPLGWLGSKVTSPSPVTDQNGIQARFTELKAKYPNKKFKLVTVGQQTYAQEIPATNGF